MQDRRTPEAVDVSVVIIVFNDAERLGTAVRSVTDQSLHNLEVIIADDASTDDTAVVARRLMAEDSRVRYVRREQNSGGCGAPRNMGVEHARGRYVMFLDSDDRYERHACKNLLEAAEATGADFAMGMALRENMDTGRVTRWFPSLFAQERVVGGLRENPELIQDVLSVNKLYRADFLARTGLRFPEDVHYEDQIFSFRAYLEAERIAVIPEAVYIWQIFPSHERSSITRQRHEITNLRHRITVHRRLDDFITTQDDSEDLAAIKDVKFLENDLRLYLGDMIEGDPAFSAMVLDEIQDYLRSIPRRRFERIPPALRAGYGMALRTDVEGVRECMLMDRRNVLRGRVSQVGERWWWSRSTAAPGPSPDYAPDAPENALLDVTGTRLVDSPVTAYDLPHELEAWEPSRSGLVLSGRTFDGLGRLADDSEWAFDLVVRHRGSADVLRLPMTIEGHHDGMVTWRVTLPVGGEMFSTDNRARWDLYVDLSFRGGTWRSGLRWQVDANPSVPVSSPLGRVLSERLYFYRSMVGHTAVRVDGRPHLRGRVMRRINRRVLPWLSTRIGDPVKRAERWTRPRVAYRLMRLAPLRDDLAVFEAQLGTIYGDSPKYVHQELSRRRPDLRSVWVLPAGHPAPAPRTHVVQRDSYGYLWALARGRYLVDNQTFPRYFAKRKGQTYLQTWHGIPLKRMGQDIGDPAVLEREERGLNRGVAAWDHLVVPNPYFERVFVPAFRYTGNLVRYGTPRNDPLARGSFDHEVLREHFDIRPGKKILLYAPTFRAENRSKQRAVPLPFDIRELTKSLGPDWVILLRAHYLNRFDVPGAVRSSVLDTTDIEDVNEVYAAADVLVTDFSSSMFDFAVTGKPIVYFIQDYREYAMTRGMYFDLRNEAPGPMVDTTAELAKAVQQAVDDAPHPAYQPFVDAYCGREDGQASRRAVDALLGTHSSEDVA